MLCQLSYGGIGLHQQLLVGNAENYTMMPDSKANVQVNDQFCGEIGNPFSAVHKEVVDRGSELKG